MVLPVGFVRDVTADGDKKTRTPFPGTSLCAGKRRGAARTSRGGILTVNIARRPQALP